MMQLDLALSDYGEEARPERAKLRDSVRQTIDEIWSVHQSDTNFVADNLRPLCTICATGTQA
jgi:hypothetical protein